MRKPTKAGKKRTHKKHKLQGKKRILWLLALFVAAMVYFLYDLPDIDNVKPLETKPSITILANDGTLIARYGGMQGNTVKMRDLPQHLVAAVLSVEDRRFYWHFGIDPLGLARAMWVNLRHGRWVQGGSTITQQLAKNMFLTPDKTIRRKVQEAIMALRIEHKFTKAEILLAYLNRVYFGAGAYGIDAASKTYFRKPPAQLTLPESAMLAGLLKAPSHFSPATNPKRAEERAKVVIRAMHDAGHLDEKTAARQMEKVHAQTPHAMSGDLNHYFSDWVIDQIDSFIATTDSDIVVKTTLDPKLQLMAEAKQKALFKRIKPEDKVTQAAVLTEAPDGAILAMTGGVDYAASQFNRATQARRQPGSTFKPFVYLAALEAGFDPDTKIEDAPLREGSYRPDNYDNKYYGTVTLTDALAHSLNTATIRLLQLVGISQLIDVADRMGFAGRLKPELSSALGTDEVNLLELTNAYTIIANGGRAVWPYAVLSIKDGDGHLIYQYEGAEQTQVFSRRDIYMLDSMLVQVIARGSGQAAQLSRGHTAGKTGTTQNYRDAWFLGYTDKLVTGIWMGNDDNTTMNRVTGGKYPAQLWHDYMNEAINFDIPVFRPETFPSQSDDGGFSSLLERWSSPATPDRQAPVYNK